MFVLKSMLLSVMIISIAINSQPKPGNLNNTNEIVDSSMSIATENSLKEVKVINKSPSAHTKFAGPNNAKIKTTKTPSTGILATVPSNNSFKSYMSYKTITSKTSKQYKLQQKATTGKYGIRVVKNRYLIAIGTGFSAGVGTNIDIEMENGAIIECIVGDIKSDKHTDPTHRQQKYDKSVVEFIVDTSCLSSDVKSHGDISYANKAFEGEIRNLILYKN